MDLLTIGHFETTRIAVASDPAIIGGHQWICIAHDEELGRGLWLATLLQGMSSHTIDFHDGWYWVQHTAETDERLRALVDLCAAIRRAAPGLVQLTLTGIVADD